MNSKDIANMVKDDDDFKSLKAKCESEGVPSGMLGRAFKAGYIGGHNDGYLEGYKAATMEYEGLDIKVHTH